MYRVIFRLGDRRHVHAVGGVDAPVLGDHELDNGFHQPIMPHPMSAEATRALRLAIRKSKSELEKASRSVRKKRQSGS